MEGAACGLEAVDAEGAVAVGVLLAAAGRC